MLTAGYDVRLWVEEGLELASQGQATPITDDHLADLLTEECACKQPIEFYDFDVDPIIGYCETCWTARTETPVEIFAKTVANIANMFGGGVVQRLDIGTNMRDLLVQRFPGRNIRDVDLNQPENKRSLRLLDCVRG
jgi:hypothetical protein